MNSRIENGKVVQTARKRSLDSKDKLKALFQGSNVSTGYPGDRLIKTDGKLSVQIHRLHITALKDKEITDDGGQPVGNVMSLAIWIPESIGKDFIGQEDNKA